MNRSSVANRWNLELIDENYQQWTADPASVDPTWQFFFEGYELGRSGDAQDGCSIEGGAAQAAVTRLIDAYREIGHYLADLDPLDLTSPGEASVHLEPSTFGLTDADLDRTFHTKLVKPNQATLRELIQILRETYCRTIGVEFMHIRDVATRSASGSSGTDGADPEPPRIRHQEEAPDRPTSSMPPSCSKRSSAPALHGRRNGSRSKAARDASSRSSMR